MKIVLITGGCGFVGSHLCQQLSINNKYKIRVLDNLSTGKLEYISNCHNIEFIDGDITDYPTCQKACQNIDGVFHLAAMSKVYPSLVEDNMIDICTNNNVIGTLNILKACREQNPIPKVIYSASSTAYGMNKIPQHEDMLPDCQSPYALTKHFGELYCQLFSRLYSVPTIRLRYFMIYGPNEPKDGNYAIVTGIFFDRYKKNEPLLIHGDGSQTRDFIHVNDVVRANIMAYESELTDVTLNIGSGQNYSIQELADWISDNQIHINSRENDLKDTLADLTKTERLLKWTPIINFKDYIKSLK